MGRTLTLELITPEKLALTETADFVVLPAYEGEMGVLPGHQPYLVQLQEGEIRARSGQELKYFAISGGFAEIQRDKVSIFAETAEMAQEIDIQRARQALQRAQADIRDRRIDPLTLAQAEAAMRRAQVRLKVAELRRRPHHPA